MATLIMQSVQYIEIFSKFKCCSHFLLHGLLPCLSGVAICFFSLKIPKFYYCSDLESVIFGFSQILFDGCNS